MALVDTPKPDKSRYALTPDGKIDYEAYKGLDGTIEENGLTIDVFVVNSRRRYGHLDLLVVPKSGSGERWTERKNIVLHSDPALRVANSGVRVPLGSSKIHAYYEKLVADASS
jgi:hypothetical protein